MQKTIDEKGNIIYGDLSLQKNLKLEFKGSNNIVFFASTSSFINIVFCRNNSLVFIGDNAGSSWALGNIAVANDSVCYIGNNTTFHGVHISALESKNIIIADDCMFSWGIYLDTTDHHMIFNESYGRINTGKSIYMGDHIWCARELAILKGSFIASGSVLGAKSVNGGVKFSNSVYSGNASKIIKNDIFWTRDHTPNLTRKQVEEYQNMPKDDFIFNFEKDKFLDPNLLEAELEKFETAAQKLEFVYDYIYNNTHKNRFALFKDSDTSECKLYKDESKTPFSKLQFEVPEKQESFISKPVGAVCLVKNHLAYKLGVEMIENSKSFKGYLKMPSRLYKISKEYKKVFKNQAKLEDFSDYREALQCKNHLSYKLGNALIQAHKNWYKGGYINFYFKVLKIKKDFKKNNPKLL